MFEATESRMAAFEQLDGLRLPPEMHTVLRLSIDGLDGLLEDEVLALTGPLDERLARSLLKTGACLVRGSEDALYSWVAGGEVSVLLDLDSFLDRRDPRALLTRFSSASMTRTSYWVLPSAHVAMSFPGRSYFCTTRLHTCTGAIEPPPVLPASS